MTEPLTDVDGLLLDIDGVLATSWQPIAGSIEAMRWIRDMGIGFRLLTNTTTHTRATLAKTLRDVGFDVVADEVVTAVVATASYLHSHHPDASVYVLSDGDAAADLHGVDLVDSAEDAEVIVIGGACDAFTYDAVNRIFRRLMDGAALVGMHRNLFWRTAAGWELDGGAYLRGLESASGLEATVCGKPARAFFASALSLLGVSAPRAVMVGDDIASDIQGAQVAGLRAVQVRTGKFRDADLAKATPDRVIDALEDLPSILGG